MKIVLPLLTVLLLANAEAQTTQASLFGGDSTNKNPPSNLMKIAHAPNRSVESLKSWKDAYKQLQQSPFKASYSQNHNLGEQSNNYSKQEWFKNNFIIHDFFLNYNYDRQNAFRIANRFTTYSEERAHSDWEYRHVEGRYQRRGILRQADHGVDMSAELRQGYNVDEKYRTSRGADGFSRAQLNFSRQFTPAFSMDLNLVNFINYRNTSRRSAYSSTRSSYLNRVILTPNYAFNDTWVGSMGIFWDHGVISDQANTQNMVGGNVRSSVSTTESPKHDNLIFVDPALNYVVNSWLNIDFDFAWAIWRSHDQHDGLHTYGKTNNRYWGYWGGVTFNFTIF